MGEAARLDAIVYMMLILPEYSVAVDRYGDHMCGTRVCSTKKY